MYGFYNKLLKINMTTRSVSEETIPDEVFEKHLGGKGLGAYLMLKEIPAKIDPLSAENKLIFTVGALADTKIWGSARFGVFCKSPLTGIFGESYCGGKVAPVMKRIGRDAIVIEGRSDKPVYLEISDKEVKFHDAGHLWGKDCFASEDAILEEVGVKGVQAVVIGPAGERLVRFALIESNYWRSAGRCGMGAVMGSKNLKGIAFHGSAECEVADPEAVKRIIKGLAERTKDELKGKVTVWRENGTIINVDAVNEACAFPTRYWTEGKTPSAENLGVEFMRDNFDFKSRACPSCFLACGNVLTVNKGPYKGLTIEGPEYETIYSFGGLNCLNGLDEVAYLNDICDRLGIDTMTAGNVTAFAIEARKRGKIDFEIDYGQTEQIAQLLRMISAREGIGDILAEGVKKAAEVWGLEEIAVHVKGLEPGGYDPRALKGIGLQYAVSSRGACHMRGTVHAAELSGQIDPDIIEGKAEVFVENENLDALFDSFILCRFFRSIYLWDEMAELIKATMGLEWDRSDLERTAKYITTQARLFNTREGISKKDDTLPGRFFNEPLGPDGKTFTEAEFNQMREEYYNIHGWNKDGVPNG